MALKNRRWANVFCIFGVCGVLFGFIGFTWSTLAILSLDKRVEFSGQPVPLHEINGVAVDSMGYLYYGSDQNNSIQIFDENGTFLRRITFPTSGGAFAFYVDENDQVQVATARGGMLYTFAGETLVFEGSYEAAESGKYFDDYRKKGNRKQYVDEFGNEYYVTSDKKVHVINAETRELLRIVSPKTPIWPFSIMAFWGIGLVSAMVVIGAALYKMSRLSTGTSRA
ncbi:hypothetical protein LJC64_00430 [Ruminococcaceae bacterium OttesenSCG-928-A11]|nr:hypothetical protein [Ruminococcaceae bacterium OttesenSCG-928-A11]